MESSKPLRGDILPGTSLTVGGAQGRPGVKGKIGCQDVADGLVKGQGDNDDLYLPFSNSDCFPKREISQPIICGSSQTRKVEAETSIPRTGFFR